MFESNGQPSNVEVSLPRESVGLNTERLCRGNLSTGQWSCNSRVLESGAKVIPTE